MKKKLMIEIGVAILLVLILGITYAYFTGRILNNDVRIGVNSSLVDFTLTNTKVNVSNLMPIYDVDYESAYKHTFEVQRKNNSNLGACYSLSLVIDEIGSSIANEYLKYKLEYNGVSTEGNFSNKTNGDTITLITNQSYEVNDTSSKEYTLYIWLSYDENIDQTSMLTGNETSRTLKAHLEMNGSTNECIDSNIPVTAYLLNEEETEISYSEIYSKLGEDYEVDRIDCTNGSVYSYNSSTNQIELVSLKVPDTCTIYFKTIDADLNIIAIMVEQTQGQKDYINQSEVPTNGYYLSDVVCTVNGQTPSTTVTATYDLSDGGIKFFNLKQGTKCNLYFDRGYLLAVESNNNNYGTVTPNNLYIGYGGTAQLTITPASGYYLSAFSCTNGYTYSGVNTGSSYTGSQTATISNNNQNNNTTCTATFKSTSCTVTRTGSNSWKADYNCVNGTGIISACYRGTSIVCDGGSRGEVFSFMCTLSTSDSYTLSSRCNASSGAANVYGGGMPLTISCSC